MSDRNDQEKEAGRSPPKSDTDKMWEDMISDHELTGIKIRTTKPQGASHES